MTDDLKPCPFCGKIPEIIISENSNPKSFYRVECKRMSCTALVSTFAYRTKKEAKNNALNVMAECQYSYLNLLLVGILKRYGVMCSSIDEVIEQIRIALEAYDNE